MSLAQDATQIAGLLVVICVIAYSGQAMRRQRNGLRSAHLLSVLLAFWMGMTWIMEIAGTPVPREVYTFLRAPATCGLLVMSVSHGCGDR